MGYSGILKKYPPSMECCGIKISSSLEWDTAGYKNILKLGGGIQWDN
jgi:hypothetical protein